MAKRKQYPRSASLERRVQVYPPPKYFRLFMAYVTANEMKESEAAGLMVRTFFDSMTPAEKMRLQRVADERNTF